VGGGGGLGEGEGGVEGVGVEDLDGGSGGGGACWGACGWGRDGDGAGEAWTVSVVEARGVVWRVEVAVRGAGGEEGEDGGEEAFGLGGGVGEEEVAFGVGGLVR